MKRIIPALLFVGLLTGCGSGNRTSQTAAETADTTFTTGSDRDGHGCIGSAGYAWSEVCQECIRPFEAGVRMLSATDPEATLCAYLVFSADSAQAELFLPDRETTEVLDRRNLPAGGHAWNIEDDDTFNVRRTADRWIIERRGTTLYRQE